MIKQLLIGTILLQISPLVSSTPGNTLSSNNPLTVTAFVLATAAASLHNNNQNDKHYNQATRFTTYPGKNNKQQDNPFKNKKISNTQKFPKNNS